MSKLGHPTILPAYPPVTIEPLIERRTQDPLYALTGVAAQPAAQ